MTRRSSLQRIGRWPIAFSCVASLMAASLAMYTTTAYDMMTGISLAVTIALDPDSPPDIQPSNEIISAVSIVLTPDHPVP